MSKINLILHIMLLLPITYTSVALNLFLFMSYLATRIKHRFYTLFEFLGLINIDTSNFKLEKKIIMICINVMENLTWVEISKLSPGHPD
jgi:hypothetical protein